MTFNDHIKTLLTREFFWKSLNDFSNTSWDQTSLSQTPFIPEFYLYY